MTDMRDVHDASCYISVMSKRLNAKTAQIAIRIPLDLYEKLLGRGQLTPQLIAAIRAYLAKQDDKVLRC